MRPCRSWSSLPWPLASLVHLRDSSPNCLRLVLLLCSSYLVITCLLEGRRLSSDLTVLFLFEPTRACDHSLNTFTAFRTRNGSPDEHLRWLNFGRVAESL